MSNSFYALMAIVFPMVYSIMVGNRMIAEKVDKGNMTGFLPSLGIAAANAFQPDALDVDTFLSLKFRCISLSSGCQQHLFLLFLHF